MAEVDFPPTKRAALAEGSKWYFTGKPCVAGHVTKRLASNGTCYECSDMRARTWYQSNPQRRAEIMRQFHLRHPEYEPDRYSRRLASGEFAAYSKARQHRVRKATPKWANLKAIVGIYRSAQEITKQTGVEHHVDHVIPIAGKNVCGLHVHTNMEVVTAEFNRRKHNSWLER